MKPKTRKVRPIKAWAVMRVTTDKRRGPYIESSVLADSINTEVSALTIFRDRGDALYYRAVNGGMVTAVLIQPLKKR